MTDTTMRRQPQATASVVVARPYGPAAGFMANDAIVAGTWSICLAHSTHKPRPRRPQGALS